MYNDLTGSLYGWRFSIYFTRLFLSLGLTASFASSLMVLTGLLGWILASFGGPFLLAGLVSLTMSYVLDCVDGEMARYRGIDSFRWAGVDYLHHLVTKGMAFLGIGVGLYRDTGNAWVIAAGALCSVSWLLLVGLRDLPMLLFAKKIVMNERRFENPAVKRLYGYLDLLRKEIHERPAPRDIWGAEFRFRPWVIRTFFTCFDVVIPMLAVTAAVDRFVHPFTWHGVSFSVTSAVVCAYAIILPLHFLDCMNTAMRGKQVRNELYQLAEKVEFKTGAAAKREEVER